MNLDTKGKWLIIELVKELSLRTLFEKCDSIKNKSRKSIMELREEYERDKLIT